MILPRRSLAFILALLVACGPSRPDGAGRSATGRSSSSGHPSSPSPIRSTASPSIPLVAGPTFKHVWVLVMENHSYEQIIGNEEAPYLNGLARSHGLATEFYAITHPSLPNYLALVAGATMGCTDDDCRGGYDGPTLAGQLRKKGLTWAGFFEGLPSPGYTGDDTGGYVRHHDPFVYFKEITGSASMRASIRPLADLKPSLSDPPSFSLVVPNNQHNMHDGPISAADAWAATYVSMVMRSPAFRDHGAVFLTWDEGRRSDVSGCCGPAIHGGHIATIVAGSGARRGFRSSVHHSTYSLLRTIENGFGLLPLRLAGGPAAVPLSEFWP